MKNKKHEYKEKRKCEICGKEFLIINPRSKYCGGPHIRKCVICGKEFNCHNNINLITCSKKCACRLTWNNKSNKEKQEILNKRVNTSLEKYGVDNPAKSEIIKEKQRQIYFSKSDEEINIEHEKRKQTMIKKYGVENIFQNTEYMINKFQEKLGVNNPFQSEVVKEKIKHTCIEKYGVEHISLSKNWQDIIKKKYNGKTQNQVHFDDFTWSVLSSKENLISYLESFKFEDRTYSNLLKKLNCGRMKLNRLILKYDLDRMINHYRSELELEVIGFIKSIYEGEIITNCKWLLHNNEIDIYLPDKKIAIECNGTYWHSEIYKDSNYHFNKSKSCEEKGIRLIHIWEYEWNNERQRPILENILLSACGKIEYKIYARNCKIEVRKSNEMKEFFEQNNIQGFRGGKFAICLIHNNEVVMSYIMGSAFFGKGKYEWEVIRGATKLGVIVVGGASKIWSYFIKNYNPNSCVYYVDYNYFNGSSILHLDNKFKMIRVQPSYKNWWINDHIVKNREPGNNHAIKQAYKEGKCYKIHNAGTKVYVWSNE